MRGGALVRGAESGGAESYVAGLGGAGSRGAGGLASQVDGRNATPAMHEHEPPPAAYSRRFPFPPYPNGWMSVGHSDELAVGEVKRLHLFGRELVAFRGEDGTAAVLDAYCPHLGAHFGHGGKVVGNELQCPFHSWRFAGDGTCTSIPYAARVPAKAAAGAYPVSERNGFVFAWFHDRGESPSWDVEVVPEILDPAYRLFRKHRWVLDTHPQEMMENGVDFPHFSALHGWKAKSIDWVPDGPYYSLKINVDIDEADEQAATAANSTDVNSYNSGPGFTYTRFEGALNAVVTNPLTVIDPGVVLAEHAYWVHESVDDETARFWSDGYIRDYGLDAPIWEHKRSHAAPVLCEADGPIAQYRAWFAQFYSP